MMEILQTMYLTDLQKKRFVRDNEVYEEYTELFKRHEGLVSKWKICQMLSPKYGVCPMGIWRIIERMEKYSKLNDSELLGASSLDDMPPMQDGRHRFNK